MPRWCRSSNTTQFHNNLVAGIHHNVGNVAVACCDGASEVIPAPGYSGWRHGIKRHQRNNVARKQKGGKRRARARYPLGGKQHQLACVRKTLLHHSSRHITGNATAVVLEDLKVQKMIASAAGTVENPGRNVAQKSGLNRGNLAQGWGLLKQMPDDKARQRVAVNPAYTSQTRPACGGAEQRSRISARDHHCVACGRIHVDSIQPSTLCGTPWAPGWSHSVEQ